MAITGRLAVAATLLALAPPSVAQSGTGASPAAECTLMLDQSLSMTGFYEGTSPKIVQLLDALAAPCGEGMVVGKGAQLRSGPLSALRPSAPFGNDTWLGAGLEKWLTESSTNRLVIVTDNVADNGSNSAQSNEQDRFYRNLKADASQLTHISMVIVRLPFEGLVYALNNKVKRRHSGKRALTLYVLERRGRRGDEALLKQVESAMRGMGYRSYGGAGEPDPSQYAVARLSPFRPGIDANTAGVSIQAEKGGPHVRLSGDMIHVGRGASDSETRFALRQVQVSTGPDWDFGNAPFRARVAFPPAPMFGRALEGPCEVVPPGSAPGLGRRLTLSISCTIPPATANMSQEERDRLALAGRKLRDGELLLAVEARRGTLSLKGPLQRHFGMSSGAENNPLGLASPTAEVQERVYRLPELLDNAIPPGDRIVIIKRFPLQADLGASGVALLARWLIGVLPWLLLLIVLAGLGWLLSRPVTYLVGGAPGTDRLTLGLGETKTVRGPDESRVDLSFCGLMLVARAAGARRILGRSGGKVPDSAGRTLVTLTRPARKTERGRAAAGPIMAKSKPGRGRRT